MDDRDRPNLGLHVRAQIERDLIEIDKRYWTQQLCQGCPCLYRARSLLVSQTKGAESTAARTSFPYIFSIPTHKRFSTRKRSSIPRLDQCCDVGEMTQEATRIRKRVMQRVDEVEIKRTVGEDA